MSTVEIIMAGLTASVPIAAGLTKAVMQLRQVLKELKGPADEPTLRQMVCKLDGRVESVEQGLKATNVEVAQLRRLELA